MRKAVLIILTMSTCVIAVSILLGSSSPNRTHSKFGEVSQQVDLSSLEPFDIRFMPQTGVQPAVSLNQALTAALPNSHGVLDPATDQVAPGVQIAAEYGTFTDNESAVEAAGSDQQTLTYVNIPAWVITFTGTTVGAPVYGPAPRRPLTVAEAVKVDRHAPVEHDLVPVTEAVVINAQSGKAIEVFD